MDLKLRLSTEKKRASVSRGQVGPYFQFIASYINLADSLMHFLARQTNIYGYFILGNH